MEDGEILTILEKHKGTHGELLSILEGIQSMYGYLPEKALKIVSDKTRYSLADIFGVATFYKAFSLKERGKHYVSACMGTACHVRGASKIVDEFERQLSVKPGETTPDKEFTLETVNCLGACALGPTIVVDGHYFRHVTTANVRTIIDHAKSDFTGTDAAGDERSFPVAVDCSRCGHTLMDTKHPVDGHPSITIAVSFDRKKGWLRLSSLYGSYRVESQHDIPDGVLTILSCPHCGETLASPELCPDCGTQMAMMNVGRVAIVYACMKRGCRGHRLDLKAPDAV